MDVVENAAKITRELAETVPVISSTKAERVVDRILESRRVFVDGAGRSGLVVKSFAMRLRHLGIESYVVGETVTPNIEPTDLLVIGSGSGETSTLCVTARKAKSIGTPMCLISTSPMSTLGRLADVVVEVPAPTPKVPGSATTSIQPMGSLFEQCLFVLLEAIVLRLMDRKDIDSETMYARHANLE